MVIGNLQTSTSALENETIQVNYQSQNVSVTTDKDSASFGDSITLSGTTTLENADMQWQRSKDGGATWQDIPEGITSTYSFVYDETNYTDRYRLEASVENSLFYSTELAILHKVEAETNEAVEEETVPEVSVQEDTVAPVNNLTYLQQAELYYGNNATQPLDTAKINIQYQSGIGENNTVLAGDTIQVQISYSFHQAGLYNYGEQLQPLFNSYDNTYIDLKLPEGMTLNKGAASDSSTVDEIILPTDDNAPDKIKGTNTYRLIFKENVGSNASSDQSGWFFLNIQIEDNGKLEVGHLFDYPDTYLSIHTEFTILDRNNTGDGTKTYTKDIETTDTLENLISTTNDEWLVEKSASTDQSEQIRVDESKNEVTLTYNLLFGLGNDDGTIITNASDYGRSGRVLFDSVTLSEIPVLKDREGEDIRAKSITITPAFGDKKEIEVKNGQITLPVDVVKEHNVGDSVDKDAPYLSNYTVQVVYPYDVFVAEYSDEKQNELTNENTVIVKYKLKGEQTTRTTESSAWITYGEVTEPAQLIIGKTIVSYDETGTKKYTKENFGSDDIVHGNVTFKITREDSDEAVTLYKKVTENGATRYEVLSNNGEVTLSGSDDDGNVEVYLDPGTYTVSEGQGPSETEKVKGGNKNAEDRDVTLTAGNTVTTEFYNKETLGEINIHKVDQDKKALSGAGFTVYSDQACTNEVAKSSQTGSTGLVSVTRLSYGTYYVKETTIPSDYLPDENLVKEVTISKDDPTVELTFKNTQNAANLLIQKQVFDERNNIYVDVGASNHEQFNKAFTLQKKVNDSWENVSSGLSLTQDGKISISNLPVYEADGTTLITYRITEKLPENFTANTGAKDSVWESVVNGIAYTKEFNLEDAKGGKTHNITLKNESFASLTVTKEFYAGTKEGIKKETDSTQEAIFELYVRTTDGGSLTKVANSTIKLENDETYIFNRLNFKTGEYDNEYYLVETNVDGYRVSDDLDDEDGSYSEEAIVAEEMNGFNGKTVIGPFIPGGEGADHQTVVVKNVKQEVPVLITKEDSITGDFVDGAKYTLTKTGDGQNDIIKQDVAIPKDGSLVLLEPGEYTVKETQPPKNYTDVTAEDDKNISISSKTKVDLGTEVITITLKNRPDPKIKVTKQLVQADRTSDPLTGVTFDIYTKSGDNFKPYQVNGTTVTITSSGSDVQLPVGEYYLREQAKEGVLDPTNSNNFEFYENELGDQFDNGYFGPFEVSEVEKNKNNSIQTIKITNYSSNGAVNVQKFAAHTDGKTSSLQGAIIGIYESDKLETPIKKATSNASGEVSFKDLPIYDKNGNQIKYVIKEISAPSGYTVSEDNIEVTLKPGEVINADFKDNNYQIVNQPVTSLTINKTYYNAWEYEFTEKEYPLPGVTIALYKENAYGNYDFVETQVTDDAGNVKFENLTQKDKYVAVEVSIPDEEAYQYLRPENGKYLSEGYPTGIPKQLTSDEITKYYTVTKKANASSTPDGALNEKMVNIEHWTQLWIEKYKMVDSDFKYTEANPTPDPETETEPVYVNNAEFELYQQVVSEDSGNELSFNKENCTLIGTYTSGTLYDEDGKRKDGWFSTDVLKSDENIVYWLVETKPGIGSEIIPENQIILIKHEGTEYTNSSQSLNDPTQYCTEEFVYQEDKITEHEIENEAVYGPGSAMFSTVRLTKWAGKRDQQTGEQINEYTPLGNTTFGLYLADSKGNLHGKLDTLTTGLDNDITEENAELTAWASSKAFSWKHLTETYNYEKENALLSEEEYNDIFRKDEQDNGYVRVAIVEESTVAGYQPFTNTYYMYMYFQNKEGETTETFNDAFYVKSDDPDSPKLSQEIPSGKFTLYPADETGKPIGVVNVAGKPADAVEGQYRFVNWPIDNYAVTVHKYGYEVSKDTLDKDEDQLQEHFNSGADDSRIALPNVEMKIQYFDTSQNKWIDSIPGYDANSEEYNDKGEFVFETDQSGQYTFKKGLNIGYYRIIEISGDPGYENIYNGEKISSVTDGDIAAYYFHVYNDNVDINMYNPKKQSLTVHKTDMSGTDIKGVAFKLNKVGSTTSVEQDTDNQGKTTFTNLDSGNYVLSESIDTNSSYSDNYFTKQFKQTYSNNSDIQNLVNSGGLYLGYTTAQSTFANGSAGVKITEKKDLKSYIKTGDVEVQVKNPAKGSMTIQKVASHDGDLGLPGATFTVSYKAFDKVDGTVIALSSDASNAFGSPKQYTTDTNGKINMTGMEPGVYKIEETSAPSGYEKTPDVRYVVITGGLSIGKVTVDGKEIDQYKTQVDDNQTFTNKKLVSLTVNKKINEGKYTDVSGTFTFNLYDSSGKQVDSKKLDYPTNKSVTFNYLKQGATYYLEEENSEDYTLTSIKKNTVAIQPENNGRYKIEVPDNSTVGVTVTATNRYQKATIRFLKVDGDTGDKLTGAQFELYRVKDDGAEEKVNDAVFKDEGDGKYSCEVTLQSDKETFHIRETKAPNNYIAVDDLSIETTVTAGKIQDYPVWNDNYKNQDSVMVANRIMPNYKGAYIDLTKYDNVHGAKGNPLEGASFTVYRYDSETQTWVVASTQSTNKDGKIHFVVSGGERYALSEGTVSGFAGLDGVWSVKDEKETAEVSSFEGTLDDGSKATLYPINGDNNITAGQTYAFNAYNIPYEGLRIEKRSADTGSPTATVDVYKLNDEYSISEDLTNVDVNALISGQTPIASNIAVDTSDKEGFMYADETTDSALQNKFVAGDKVLVVETSSSYPIVKDNKQVQWFDIIEIKADDTNSAELKNINPSVNYTIDKKVVKEDGSTVDNDDELKTSLMTEGTEIDYRLNVSSNASSTYPLAQFIVEDTGLSATDTNSEPLNFGRYLEEKYSYSKVTLGKPSHDTTNIADGDSYPIQATVTFIGFNDQTIHTQEVSWSGSDTTKVVKLPENVKAKAVKVEYFSEELKQATGNQYVLGQNFEPGTIDIQAVVDRQTDPNDGIIVKNIDKLTNNASVTAGYYSWDTSGNKSDAMKTSTDNDASYVTFATLDAPKVSITKKAVKPGTDTEENEVSLDTDVEYELTITNINDSTSQAKYEKPFLVDLLPKGTSLKTYDDGQQISYDVNELGDLSIRSTEVKSFGEERALFIYFDGDLSAGKSATVRIKLKVDKQVSSFGVNIDNYVLAGSQVLGIYTDGNEQASSFMTEDGNWPLTVDGQMTEVSDERKNALKEMLGQEAQDYGYVSTSESIKWITSSTLTLVKSAHGDADSSNIYTTDVLSAVTNGGKMNYRLTVGNTSGLQIVNNVRVVDILPTPDDFTPSMERGSDWALQFGGITDIYALEKDVDGNLTDVTLGKNQYTVYYYTGAIHGSEDCAKIYEAAQTKDLADLTASGWTTDENATNIRAFIVAFNEDVKLEQNEHIAVEYSAFAQTPEGKPFDEDTLNSNAYKNAVNNFAVDYTYYFIDKEEDLKDGDLSSSNVVSNTIYPSTVSVGGQIWIDKNNNGIRETGEDASSMKSDAIISDLLSKADVTLNIFYGNDSNNSLSYSKQNDWNGKFEFDRIYPAAVRDNYDPYGSDVYDTSKWATNDMLKVDALKTSQPRNYTINVSLNDVQGQFKVTKLGDESGYSREPAALSEVEKTDNNFIATGTGDTSYVSERFFLWSVGTDKTKDIGLVPTRSLTIHKVANDDPSVDVQGAEFTVYGPFEDEQTITASDLNDANEVGTYKTDINGNITIEDLLWYQEYVIVEEQPGTGYKLDDAQATGQNIESISVGNKAAWRLGVPGTQQTQTTDTMTVTNVRKTSVDLEASKVLTHHDLNDYTFTFKLMDEDGKQIQTAENDKDGNIKFKNVTLTKPGEHVFYMEEVAGSEQEITYSTEKYKVTVSVSWKEDTGLTVDEVTYEKYDSKTNKYAPVEKAVFTNRYEATGALDITAGKTVNDGQPHQTFSFTLSKDNQILQTKESDANGNIKFDSIAYDESDIGEEYTYTVQEQNTSIPGYTIDSSIYTIKVQITDDGNGQLKVDKTITKGENTVQEITFNNVYEPKGEWTPQAYKVLNGRDMRDEESFSFGVFEGNKQVSTGTIGSLKDGQEAKINFTSISYTKESIGEHTYTIKETTQSHNGITVDGNTYTIKVKVEDVDFDGDLKVSVLEAPEKIVFTNTYAVEPIDVSPMVQKTVTGHELNQTQNFTFDLSQIDGESYEGVTMPTDTSLSMEVDPTIGSGQAFFDEVTFAKEGTYSFRITEQRPSQAGYETYDQSVWTWTVVIEANDEIGKLEVISNTFTKENEDKEYTLASFTNIYQPSSTTASLQFNKVVESVHELPEAKDFTFVLKNTSQSDGIIMPQNTEKTISVSSSNQSVSGAFDEITFTKAGQYTFQIQEKEPEETGAFTYDKTIWNAEVTVEDDAGQLVVRSVTYRAGTNENTQSASFENQYMPNGTEKVLQVEKTLKGDDIPKDKAFEFVLKADSDNPEGAILPENTKTSVVFTPESKDVQQATFDSIQFTKAGEYHFTIREVGEDGSGYTYDETVWTVTIKVTDHKGQLQVDSVQYENEESRNIAQAEFTNTYDVDPVDHAPSVEKKLGGDVTPTDKAFIFTLSEDQANDTSGYEVKDVKTSVSGQGKASFDAIHFTKAGIYTFYIQEEKPDYDGYEQYDTSVWTLILKVEDKDGQLEITKKVYRLNTTENQESAVFENVYQPEDISYAPKVHKSVSGNRIPGKGQSFRFVLSANEDYGTAITMPEMTEISVLVSQEETSVSKAFNEIQFHEAGAYAFTIREINDGEPGYTYDDQIWTLQVHVEDQDGHLAITKQSYQTDQENSTEQASFENIYQVKPVDYAPLVEKTVQRDSLPEEGQDFTFVVEPSQNYADDLTMPEDNEVTVHVNETGEPIQARFDSIRFHEAGTYSFLLKEKQEQAPGFTYDESIWTLTLKVIDEQGVLRIEDVTYTCEDQTQEMASFINIYEVKPVQWQPSVKKTILGDTPTNKETFQFELSSREEQEGMILPEDLQMTIAGEGQALFEAITFTKAGVYEFEVYEVTGFNEAYTYDTSVWTVRVTVTDEDAKLQTKVEYLSHEKSNTEFAEFENVYHEPKNPEKPDDTSDTSFFTQAETYVFSTLASGGILSGLYYRKRKHSKK